MKRHIIAAAGIPALSALLLVGCSSGASQNDAATGAESSAPAGSMPSGTMSMDPSGSAAKSVKGGYIDYAEYMAAEQSDKAKYAESDVVLFFNASWCPTCQEATKNLSAAKFPEGLTVVSVDYDSHDDLLQQYGVTYQHTFVQVDPSGKQLAKFSGSTTVEHIQDQLA